MIAEGVNVNAFGRTNRLTALDFLLGHHIIDRNKRNKALITITEIASNLLAADANPNGNGSGVALVGAASAGYANIVKMLLKAGANPNIRDANGDTPLIMAGFSLLNQRAFGYDKAGLIEIIKDLLKAGANPNAKSEVRKETIKNFIERAEILTDEERAELLDLLRKH